MQTSALMAIVMTLVASAHALAQPNFDFHQPIQPPRKVQVMVHRGMSCAAPENSAIAIEMCAQDYCEWTEIDVRLSKDGHHVIIHNDTVDAATNGTGRVGDLTLQDLKKLDAGSWFAKRFASSRLLTLTEALELARGKINLVLDCKSVHPRLLVEEVIAAGMERQVIVAGSPEDVPHLQSAAKGKVACMAKFRPKSMTFDAFVKQLNPAAVEIDVDEITPALCQQFHAIGIKVQVKVLGKDWDNPVFWGNAIDSQADWVQTDDPAGFLFFSARKTGLEFPVKIAAHRGANRYAPENTLPAIHVAARLVLDYAEIDIRTTLDGNLVLMHDNTLNRTTDRNGTVRETKYEEMQNLVAGNWFGLLFRETRVPSFDDGLRALGEKMGVYLDAKEVEATELVAAIHKFHLEERHVVYQSVDYCKRIHELEPKVRTLPPLKHREQLDAVAAIHPYGVDAAWSILSEEMIADCHNRGIQVFSDAIGRNETVEQYQQAIGWGIDCIQTDHPLRVLRAIEEIVYANAKQQKINH